MSRRLSARMYRSLFVAAGILVLGAGLTFWNQVRVSGLASEQIQLAELHALAGRAHAHALEAVVAWRGWLLSKDDASIPALEAAWRAFEEDSRTLAARLEDRVQDAAAVRESAQVLSEW